jgi:hypothetical protein
MGGFLSGLGELLGGFNAQRRIDTEGFDWREKAAQEEAERQRTQQEWQQSDEDRTLSQMGDVLASQEGDPDLASVESMIPGQLDAGRKKWMAQVALGQLPERKSRIEANKAYSQYQRELLKGDQRRGDIEARGAEAQELERLREENKRGRTLSPADQAKLEMLERNAARADARASAGRANMREIAGMGTLRPLVDDEGKIYGFYNNRNGEYVPAEEGMAGARVSNVPAAEREKRAALQGISDDIRYIAEIAPKHQDKIGRFAGPLAEIQQSFIGGDQEAIDLFSISDNISDQLLRARSGAQINEQEYARLRKITPNPRTSPDKFFADLRRFQFEIDRLLEQRTSPSPGLTPVQTQRPRQGVAPTAPAPAGGKERMVKYQGKLVPLSSLPPELQALVK